MFGTNSLNMAGGLRYIGATTNLNSFLPAGQTVTVASINTLDFADGLTAQPIGINSSQTSTGRIEINSISGSGAINIGNTQNQTTPPRSVIVLNGANANYSGRTTQNRSTLILAHDQVLGTGTFTQGNPNQRTGFDIMSDNDSRKISNLMAISQWQTVTGEHSLEWAGIVAQNNGRGFINLLPGGKGAASPLRAISTDAIRRTAEFWFLTAAARRW